MASGKDISSLIETLGYDFRDRERLVTALTHTSYANESRARGKDCKHNERLEFLGDAVLQIFISDFLYRNYTGLDEGHLTQLRQQLVCESTLATLARNIRLGDYLRLGRGEEQSGGRDKPSVLADAFEAVLGAMYLDDTSPDHLRLRDILIGLIRDEADRHAIGRIDYKSHLQQLVQQDGDELLSYETVSEDGPAHNRVFTVRALINSNVVGSGTGKTKREAEQNAAREALILFGVKD